MKKIDEEIFLIKCRKIHNDKYDYSLVNYINMRTKIDIICYIHGKFNQKAQCHILGQGCPICAIKYKNIKKSLSPKQFIDKSNKIHGDKYDYSLVKYKNNYSKVKIICKEHGLFEQIPNSHLNGNGCPSCGKVKKMNNKSFIERSQKIHGNKYDYSSVKYKNIRTKVDIICREHGSFKISPLKHIHRIQGCPKCNESKGEIEIRNILESNNIIFKSQKRFKECKNINILPFDFYLPEHNICIEFDGIQHFKPMNIWGGIEEFKNIQKRDQIKNEYCKNNNIRLLRIKYNEDIENKLINIIF